MTTLFNGLAGILNDVFGGPVSHRPQGGAAVAIQAVFREEPISVQDEDGAEVLIVAPTLQVQKPVAETITRKDLIVPGNGKSYRVMNRHPNGSPAADAFVVFELEEAGT